MPSSPSMDFHSKYLFQPLPSLMMLLTPLQYMKPLTYHSSLKLTQHIGTGLNAHGMHENKATWQTLAQFAGPGTRKAAQQLKESHLASSTTARYFVFCIGWAATSQNVEG